MPAEPRAHRTVPRGYVYADHIPYVTPDSLSDLRGPTSGVVTVGPHIDTSMNPVYEVSDPRRARELYGATVRDGSVVDQVEILDRRLLLRLWPQLNLPTRCRAIWEQKFPELAARSRAARAA
ncbi:hypothetical protein APR04_004838 [Promicromonospora umidemergens]|uniref:Transcriptional regulator n=1 Tax=Promicromonospora umidemergens TaxID=629679 RepID=A0ABP8WCU6_9MICO|nr:hypothetical protein [Promicromonospora umidemergens]MCP2285902.1 hypothetical protein [Promicromonospora umidemergens]